MSDFDAIREAADKAEADDTTEDAAFQAQIQALQTQLDTANQQKADIQAAFDAYKLKHPDTTPPPPPIVKAVVGASLGQPLPVAQNLDAVRLYSPSKVAGRSSKVIVLSDKSSNPAATVAAVKANPNVTFYCTFNHEPDDDINVKKILSPAQWGAVMNAFGKALQSLPNAEFGPIHNGSFGKAVWDADSANCDKSLWTFWGMDRYSPKYEAPSSQFAEGAAYAKALGLPLVIGECGADPSNATAQKTLAGQIRAWALDPANNAPVVCWWQQTGYQFANADVQHAMLG